MINRIAELAKENAELKGTIDAYKMSENEANEIIAELKAENERLKEEIKNNKSAYQVELGTYNMECGNLLEENKQLYHTLQEIKAYAESIGNEEMINGYAIRAKSALWRIANRITKAEEE